jgi:hypothetical protein
MGSNLADDFGDGRPKADHRVWQLRVKTCHLVGRAFERPDTLLYDFWGISR